MKFFHAEYPYGVVRYSASPPPTGMLPYMTLREHKRRKVNPGGFPDTTGDFAPDTTGDFA